MIRHIVFFSAKDKSDIARILDGLRTLKTIPNVQTLEVAQNAQADTLSNEVDIVVYAEFTNQAELDAYKAHPTYQKAIEIVRPLRALRIAADFTSSS